MFKPEGKPITADYLELIKTRTKKKQPKKNSQLLKKIEKMNNLNEGPIPKVSIPPFNNTPKYRPTEKFTNTTFYLYPKAFLEGLALASVFQSADLCTNAILFVIDEYADMVNNFTLSF